MTKRHFVLALIAGVLIGVVFMGTLGAALGANAAAFIALGTTTLFVLASGFGPLWRSRRRR